MWRRWRRAQFRARESKPPFQFTSIFDDGEALKMRRVNTCDASTGTEESFVTNIVDPSKPASHILTAADKEPLKRFEVALPEATTELVDRVDIRVDQARIPHPTFGHNIMSLCDVEVLAHICSFIPLRALAQVSRVSVSWFYASLFDNVWLERQVSELYSRNVKQLRSLKQHAAAIAERADQHRLTAPALDFIHGSHALESSRSIFIMHVSEQWGSK
jgi:hypothetical protein